MLHVEYGIVVYPSALTEDVDVQGLGVDITFTDAYSKHIGTLPLTYLQLDGLCANPPHHRSHVWPMQQHLPPAAVSVAIPPGAAARIPEINRDFGRVMI